MMYPKVIAAIVSATLLGAMLLSLRQHRLETMHEMTALHSRVSRVRQSTWDRQVHIAQSLEPSRLRDAVARAELDLEPITPLSPQATAGRDPRLASARHGQD